MVRGASARHDAERLPEQTYWTFSYSPLYDGGKIVGMINVASDATPTVVAREREAALHNEMIHRLKNTLAVASAIVSSTLRKRLRSQ